MKTRVVLALVLGISAAGLCAAQPEIWGELKTFHPIRFDFVGPHSSETADPNPFIDYRLNVQFVHEHTGHRLIVPGHFAADGNAAESSATEGNVWRAYFTPPLAGRWRWVANMRQGNFVALTHAVNHARAVEPIDGMKGWIDIEPTDKQGRDFRGKGFLEHTGGHYPQFSGSFEYFLKQGPDAPENLLAYADFDGSFHQDGYGDEHVKTWAAHEKDWEPGDPSWQNGKGKGLIGALNYLASEGLNAVSFLTMNINGDDKNVFPYVDYHTHDRFDVSKLDQWNLVFTHAQEKGIFLHFKTQEAENQGLLDHGGLGVERSVYYRELVSRFGHHLALNWNLGEENGLWIANDHPSFPQGRLQRVAMIGWFMDNDPYNHPIVVHNGYYYDDLYGPEAGLDGASLQHSVSAAHDQIMQLRELSRAAGYPWLVAYDEQGPATAALPPDAIDPEHFEWRSKALWGALLAGAWGNEWYFGYKHPHSDLTCQDWRSRDLFWNMCRYALEFFEQNEVPFWEMEANPERLRGTAEPVYCLAKSGEIFVVYMPAAMPLEINLGRAGDYWGGLDLSYLEGHYSVHWYNPRSGGGLQEGSVRRITVEKGQQDVWKSLGLPPERNGDWVALLRRQE